MSVLIWGERDTRALEEIVWSSRVQVYKKPTSCLLTTQTLCCLNETLWEKASKQWCSPGLSLHRTAREKHRHDREDSEGFLCGSGCLDST